MFLTLKPNPWPHHCMSSLANTLLNTCILLFRPLVNSFAKKLALTDTFGDGWVGGLPGHYNLWSIHQVGEEVAVTGGTLADDHESSEVRTCLADGDYSFTTTATKAFSSDMGWRICNEYGVAGEDATWLSCPALNFIYFCLT